MSRRTETAGALALVMLLALATGASAQDDGLVTPVRVGRADAPMTLNIWAQPDYFHLAARPAIADAFTIVLDDWARAHPAVQLRVSVMPGLELHKIRLLGLSPDAEALVLGGNAQRLIAGPLQRRVASGGPIRARGRLPA